LEFIDERISDDKRWDVTGEIKKFGKNILDEEYVEKGAVLREKLKDPDCIRRYRQQLRSMLQDVEEQMKGFGQQFFELLEGEGLTVDDLPYKQSGIASYFRKLTQGIFDDKIRSTRVEKHLESAQNWAGKTSPRRGDIIDLAEDALLPLLRDAEELRPRNLRIANSCRLSLRYVNHIRLLTHIDEEMRHQNHEQNRFLLAATNALLHKLVKEGDSSFVYEKLGTTIRHVMIDEFQDTSKMQWQNFRQLLTEGLSQGEDSLIVGDVKQSIYRWRNGDWRILNGLKDRMDAYPIRVETLTINRRSEGNVIRFNNRLFRQSVEWLNARYRETAHEECQPLLEAYADVEQQVGRKHPDRGYVEVNFLPTKGDDVNYAEDTLRQLAERVDSLVHSGVALKDIAILVRRNRNIPEVAAYFDEHTSYKIVSDEAFRLDASAAVSLLIAALRYLHDEHDGVSLAQLTLGYQQEVMQTGLSAEDLMHQAFSAEQVSRHGWLPEAFIRQTDELRMMPLYELIERLFRVLQLQRIPQQTAYLCAFFDAVNDYLQEHSSDLGLFLTHWDEKLSSHTIPSGEVEGVRILSIHKSKGLEYHTVLIPYCDWALEKERNLTHRIWCAPQAEPFNQLDIVPVDYSEVMNESVYRRDYQEERVQLWVDNLNVLYVALTRARCNLIIWAKQDDVDTVSQMMREALGTEVHDADDPTDGLLFRYGTQAPSVFPEDQDEKHRRQEHEEPSLNKLTSPAQPLPLELKAYEMKAEFQQSNRSARFIAGEDTDDPDDFFIRRGLLLHALFSEIRTPQDVPAAIERLRMEGLISTQEDEDRILKLTRWALGHPQVKEWFSGQWKLYNECNILTKDEQGNLVNQRPDRVMRKGDQVVVVDFKFGKKRDEYRQQVGGYMQLMRRMGFTDVKGYIWYVYLNELDELDK
jgi:ATP-dependent exoDNAse (exonuclease V) beta subunit